MTDDENVPTASVQLPEVPSELERARMLLMRAAFNQAVSVLQKNASALGSLAEIDELSLRRSGGRVDVALIEAAEQRALAELESAAIAFADARAQTAAPPSE